MPRKQVWPPRIHTHKQSGLDRVRIRGRDIYLGPTGSDEARQKYLELISRVESNGGKLELPEPETQSLTVAELAALYWAEAEKTRRNEDGSENEELKHIRYALRPLTYLLGDTLAADVKPRHLRSVRQLMVSGYRHPEFPKPQRPQSLVTVCNNFNRARAVFRWGADEGLIPAEVYFRLKLIKRLRAGEGGVVDKGEVPPVPEDDLAKTLAQLRPITRAMVEIQLLCGCRAGEIVKLRMADVDRSGDVWKWHLAKHKNAWRKHPRTIYLGPKCQEFLKPFLNRPAAEPVFSPREGSASYRNKIRTDKRSPKDQYRVRAYDRAIERACLRAKVPVWSAGQLRHNAGTQFVKEFGWDVARLLLGHRHIQTTRRYAKDTPLAAEEAAKRAG